MGEILKEVAAELVRPGRGILAADESVPTIGKRLSKHHVANTEVLHSYHGMQHHTRCTLARHTLGCMICILALNLITLECIAGEETPIQRALHHS
jgi:fructose-bisphosphate aldolase class 1